MQPKSNERWQDLHGVDVIVEHCRFNRVTFTREGFTEPCVMPLVRFLKEFKPAVEVSNG